MRRGALRDLGEPTHGSICHCRMCQKAFGNVFAAFTGVRIADLTWTRGEPAIFTSSEIVERGFCRDCGSNLFFHYLPKGSYGLLAGLFPDDALLPLAEEIFIDEKPDYYAFAGDAEKMTGAEVMAKFAVGQEGGSAG